MPEMQQGVQYEDETEPVTPVEPEPKKPKKKKGLSPILMVGGSVVLVILGIFGYNQIVMHTPAPADIVNPTVTPDEYWDDFEDPGVTQFAYTAEEIAVLRAWGYTGDEIEAKELEEVPADTLIAESKAAQEEQLKTLNDSTSPEYQALLNNTWLGQAPMNLPEYVEGETESLMTYTTLTYNADYTKVPAYGCTLFLKVTLEDGSYTFMECPPLRYLQLPESGNIVVTYTKINIGETTIISDMMEVAVG